MSERKQKNDSTEDIDEKMRDVIAADLMRTHRFNGN